MKYFPVLKLGAAPLVNYWKIFHFASSLYRNSIMLYSTALLYNITLGFYSPLVLAPVDGFQSILLLPSIYFFSDILHLNVGTLVTLLESGNVH